MPCADSPTVDIERARMPKARRPRKAFTFEKRVKSIAMAIGDEERPQMQEDSNCSAVFQARLGGV